MTVEPCMLGDVFSKLPPHITLSPPFHAEPAALSQYHERMQEVMEENPGGVTIHSADLANFGDHGEVPALRVGLSQITDFAIHAAAYVGAQVAGKVDGRYAGHNWSPHISLTPQFMNIEPGLTIQEAQLFHYAGDIKQVIAVYAARWASILEADQWKK